MSFLPRFFRKAPSLSLVPPSARQAGSSVKVNSALSKPSAEDRALTAAAEEKALQAAIEARDVQVVARLVVVGTSTKVRQSAAHAIDDLELLRQLIRDVRGGNDKGVYKILTSKRDALLEQTRRHEQLQAEINAASGALERHSQGSYDTSYGPLLIQFESSWEAVAAQADAELWDKVQQWIARSHETAAEHLRQTAAQAAQALAVANAAAEAQRLRQEQLQAAAAIAAEQEQILAEQKRVLAEKQQAEELAFREISSLIRKARLALSDKSISRTATVRRAIEEKLVAAPPLPTGLASQIQQIDHQLTELQGWKSFSVTPKLAELVDEMESLVDAALEPLTLADRIKNLKDQWRSLSKDAGETLEADLQRFEQAAEKAFQPCAEYFAAQALIREENLRRRDAVIAKLTAFEADHPWEQPDWKSVINLLRETKLEWRGAAVDRPPGKQQERFANITASLQGRLDAEYAGNVQQKQSLIERAQALLGSDDGRKAIDAIKALQQTWRSVGPVPREVDQRLWGEFRQHCDAVFQKREQDAATYTAGLESNKAQAIALCEQVEQIATAEGSALLEGTGTLPQLRSAFEALGEFPRADSQALRSRFDRGLDRCKESVARQQLRDAERSWSDMFDAANQVRAYRFAVVRGVDSEQLDSLKAAAEAHMAAVPRWPRNGLQAIQQALSRQPSTDLAANEAALKTLCIRAEMLTDQATPPADQALRREVQLQRLLKNMGQGAKAEDINLDTLTIEWLGVGPVEEATYQPLLQRFRQCRERGNARVR